MEATHQRRLRVAGSAVAAFVCLFLVLGTMSAPDRIGAIGASSSNYSAENLNTGIPANQADPLGLFGRIPALELTGVSADGTVIGYTSEYSLQICAMQLKTALEADGWILLENSGGSFLSFYLEKSKTVDSATLFVQCIAVGNETAIVINRW